MSTRQVAGLLAAAAPEVLPPRDTLRAVAPDRYTLKVSIDQECEQGLRLLKDLMSHVDPRMSWGDLVARVVREAVTRHDPRGGGSGQRRRRSADRAGASPRRAPKETRVAGAAVGPAQRGDESSPRAPNRARAAVAPGAPARRRSATSAPQGDTATIERQNPIAMLANAAPPRQSAPAALLDGARAGAVPSGAHAATSAPKLAPVARLDGARSGGAPSGAHAATSAPKSAPAALLDGARAGGVPSGTPATTAALQSAPAALLDGARAGGTPSGAPAATSAPKSAPAALLDGARAGGTPSGAPAATSAPKFASAPWRHWLPCRRRWTGLAARHCGARSGHLACPLTADFERRVRWSSGRRLGGWLLMRGAGVTGLVRSPLRHRCGHLVCPLTADRAARRTEQQAAPRRLASLRA